ncbi:hypothetical protein JCM8547_008828 [Rhodosporidiobolus lusitaniae]
MAAPQTLHQLLEQDAAQSSVAAFAYDSTPSAAFGANLEQLNGDARVFNMQVRAGAGSSLVGYVESAAFTSKGATTAEKPVAVLGSTSSFLALVPSLLALPEPTKRPTLTVHVSAQSSSLATDEEGEPTLVQVPELGAVLEGAKRLSEGGWNGAVVFSETAEEAALVGTGLAKGVAAAGADLVNVFDGLAVGRQLASLAAAPAVAAAGSVEATVASAVPFFSYSGSKEASKVLVLPASVYSTAAKAAVAAAGISDVGVLTVRVLKPWNAEELVKALPASARSLYVFTEEGEAAGPLFEEVLTSTLSAGSKLKVRSLPVPTATVPTVQDWASRLAKLAGASSPATLKSLLPAQAKLAVFWDFDASSGKTEEVPETLARTFSGANTGVAAKLDTKFDNFRQGGLQQAALLLEQAGKATEDVSLSSIVATSAPSLLFISAAQAVFKAYAPISTQTVDANTRIVVSANWTQEDFATKLPYSARKALVEVAAGSAGHLFAIDTDKVAKAQGVPASAVAEIVFWTLYLPATISAKELVTLLAQTPTFANWKAAKLVEVNGAVRNALTKIEVLSSWADEPVDADGNKVEIPAALPSVLVPTAAAANPDRTFSDPVASFAGNDSQKKSWHHAAHRYLFPEAFALESSFEEKLRPDLPEKNFLITVTENRRLTPNTYDRNVFHIEFDIEGTGLKYAVGEALGIHGWNDEAEVRSFLTWYGLDPEAVVSIPSRLHPHRVEQRTVFQLFQQNLDIFGKPGKSFYETLSKYATNKNEERALRFIACPEGSSTFKKMSEMDTVTYADVLQQFPSARPPIEDLVREIEEIKPRHYSIASSSNFVGHKSVHLLIVAVEWQTPKGSPRYGQCTRYLAGLQPGAKVMASVKPSVMQLPPNDLAPVIMAGLGTGAAPFRAFIQERAWQKAQGREVGPLMYYFGSRYRAQEYLYGEELEAYLTEGIVTRLGLAFSRDGAGKVYIQHKMKQDAAEIAENLKDGSFYLCGPTWPVPDVYEALVDGQVGAGKTREEAQAYIEELKEAERYVLETY